MIPATWARVQTTPAIAPEGTIYIASKDGLLYAVNPDGTKKWTFTIPVDDNDNEGYSSPTVGDDGVVYIGSSSDTESLRHQQILRFPAISRIIM